MENIKLTLETGYVKYGNSSDMQIDTLSMAVCGSDYNDISDRSTDYLDQYEQYALEQYDYARDFLAEPATAGLAQDYINSPDEYALDLAAYTEQLRDKAQMHELDESHPLAEAMESARCAAENDLRREWLYGSYHTPGLLRDASRRYGVEFTYDEKTDMLTFDIEDAEREDINGVENTPEAIGAYIATSIQNDAYAWHERNKTAREARRKNYETRKRIEAENEAKKEAARIEKLKKIIKD